MTEARGHPLGVPAARVVFPPADRAEIAAAVTEILASGALTLGPYTGRFEAAFAAAHDAAQRRRDLERDLGPETSPSRVAGVCGPGTWSCPANTFYATAAAVLQAGGRPVFRRRGNWARLALSRGHRGGRADPWHRCGRARPHRRNDQPGHHRASRACATSAGDRADRGRPRNAHGSTLDGRFAGSFGASGAFSFYPTKVVTSGEGGMLVSASEHVGGGGEDLPRPGQRGAFTANHHVRLGSGLAE